MKTILTNAFQSEGFTLNDTQLGQFADYFDMLIEWNQKINLTARFIDILIVSRVTNYRSVDYSTILREN